MQCTVLYLLVCHRISHTLRYLMEVAVKHLHRYQRNVWNSWPCKACLCTVQVQNSDICLRNINLADLRDKIAMLSRLRDDFRRKPVKRHKRKAHQSRLPFHRRNSLLILNLHINPTLAHASLIEPIDPTIRIPPGLSALRCRLL